MKRYEVVVSVTDELTGQQIITHKHDCENARLAQVMLGNVSEAAEEMGQYLPGLRVAAYEIEEVFTLTPLGLKAISGELPPEPVGGRDVLWWAEVIGLDTSKID